MLIQVIFTFINFINITIFNFYIILVSGIKIWTRRCHFGRKILHNTFQVLNVERFNSRRSANRPRESRLPTERGRHLRRNGPCRHPLCSKGHSAWRRDLHLLLYSFLQACSIRAFPWCDSRTGASKKSWISSRILCLHHMESLALLIVPVTILPSVALVYEGRQVLRTIIELTRQYKMKKLWRPVTNCWTFIDASTSSGCTRAARITPLPYSHHEVGVRSQGQGVHPVGSWTLPEDLSLLGEAHQEVREAAGTSRVAPAFQDDGLEDLISKVYKGGLNERTLKNMSFILLYVGLISIILKTLETMYLLYGKAIYSK